jgi:NAD(P)-dependent dehydrogenase (short-subunit alcohol dehydrogenase family)
MLMLTSPVLITGVSPNSIGEGLALALAAHQPGMLILASRTLSKIRVISRTIHASHPSVNVQEVVVDLSSLTSVREAADCCKRILEKEGKRLDVLFNNAGINLSERRLTEGGVEMQFATNHLGPFLLTNLLLPFMSTGKGGTRVVNTSSETHRISPVRFSDVSPVGDLLVLQLGDIFPRYHDSALEQFRSTSEVADFLVTQINQTPGAKVDFEDEPRRGMPKGMLRGDGRYEPSVAYGQSKTANVLFSVALNRRGVKSFAVMPGSTYQQIEISFFGMGAYL